MKKFFYTACIIAALLMAYRAFVVYKYTGRSNSWLDATIVEMLHSSDAPKSPYAGLVIKDGINDIGTVPIVTDKVVWTPLLPGQKITASPRTNVSYYIYVNHQPEPIALMDKDGNSKQLREFIASNFTEVGYRLAPDQGVNEVPLAFVKYRGNNPPPASDWFQAAFLVKRQS